VGWKIGILKSTSISLLNSYGGHHELVPTHKKNKATSKPRERNTPYYEVIIAKDIKLTKTLRVAIITSM